MKHCGLLVLLVALCLVLAALPVLPALPALAEDVETEAVEAAPIEMEGELLTEDMAAASEPAAAVMAAEDAAEENGVAIDETSFPDSAFREDVLKWIDKDRDGRLSDEEIRNTEAYGIGMDVKDITGIERFTELKYFSIDSQYVTSMDLSGFAGLEGVTVGYDADRLEKLALGAQPNLKELLVHGPRLKTLDLSGCPKLTELDITETKLKKLDLSKNKELKYLYAFRNKLKTLDLSKNTKLEIVEAEYNNLTSINVKNCKKLSALDVSCNPGLKKLNIGKNSKLRVLRCGFTGVTKLDIAKNKYLVATMKKRYTPHAYKEEGYSGKAIAWGGYGKDRYECVELPVKARLYNGKKLLYKSGTPRKVAMTRIYRADDGKALKVKDNKVTLSDDARGYWLALKLTPSDVACNVKWKSSNPDVVDVFSDGYIAVSKGSAKLYAYINGKKVYTLKVKIK